MGKLVSALAFAVVCCGGCSSFATLHPVRGVVTYDGKPAKGGAIQFKPVGEDSKLVISGLVMMDGTYTLNTSRAGGSRPDSAPARRPASTRCSIPRSRRRKRSNPIRSARR